MAKRKYRRFGFDQRGATLVEFALIAPVMILMIMGLGDVLYTYYAQSILAGAVQKAGRDSAIQGGGESTDAIDGQIVSMLSRIMKVPEKSCVDSPSAGTWCATRKNYANFSIIRPEPFVDSNRNGVRDAKECYTDINDNGRWDQDAGKAGQGGSDDVTMYTFRLTFARLFPVSPPGRRSWR